MIPLVPLARSPVYASDFDAVVGRSGTRHSDRAGLPSAHAEEGDEDCHPAQFLRQVLAERAVSRLHYIFMALFPRDMKG